MDDALYDLLEQAMVEAENARLDAYQEAVKRGKAEKEAIDAMRKVTSTPAPLVECFPVTSMMCIVNCSCLCSFFY